MQCYYHVVEPGVGVCTNGCGKALCRSCAEVYSKLLCPDCANELQAQQNASMEQKINENNALKSAANKAIKFYLFIALSTGAWLFALNSIFVTGTPTFIGHWVFLGGVLGLITAIKDLRFYEWGIIYRLRHVFTTMMLGPVIMSILCLIGWLKVLGEVNQEAV